MLYGWMPDYQKTREKQILHTLEVAVCVIVIMYAMICISVVTHRHYNVILFC